MFERLTSTVLQRALQEYFVLDSSDAKGSNVMDVWSGLVRWNQLELRTAWLNEKIQAKGLPFEVLQGHVNLLTISIPWSKLNLLSGGGGGSETRHKKRHQDNDATDAASIVVVLDGVQLLVRTQYEFDDNAMDQARIKSRRKALARQGSGGDNKTSSSSSSWRESFRQRLKDGILPKMADKLQFHIRDLHIRLEDIQSSPQRPMAMGLVLESLHLQHDETARMNLDDFEPTWVRKGSAVNHLAIYANALDETPDPQHSNGHPQKWSERSILQHCTQKDIILQVLDRSIPRRANSLEAAATRMAPQHTYILGPIDATAQVESGTDPALLVAQNRPVLHIVARVSTVTMALQDVHCHAGLAWYARYQDHKYRARYRPFRPRVSVASNPKAWWQYAAHCIRFELQQSRLHWSWRRFHKRYQVRKRYCDLFEQKLLVEMNANPAVTQPLSAEEMEELKSMEDGTRGELALEDIFLYRAIVQRRVGDNSPRTKPPSRKRSSLLMTKSWLQKTLLGIVDEESAESDEFLRAMDLWEEVKQNAGTPLQESTTWVAVSFEFFVEEGVIAVYTPLQSTIDQIPSKRLQVRFLSFVFEKFRAHGRLLGDFESIRLDTDLQDFRAEEDRKGNTRHTVIAREVLEESSFLPEAVPAPFLRFQFLKNSKHTTDFHIGINAEIQQLVVTLEPNCEWILHGKPLIRPLPKLTKIKEFWDEVGMNFINSSTNQGQDIFAKAETAVTDHKSIDVDIWIDCPVVRLFGSTSAQSLVVDLGQARFRTERLAGVAKSRLIGTLKNEAARLSVNDDMDGPVESSLDFLKNNTALNESMRSGQMNDMIDGIHVFRDDMTALDNLADTSGDFAGSGIESFFYDTYILDIKTGSVQLHEAETSTGVVEPVNFRGSVQRSIIPRDATLFRYKMMFSFPEFSVKIHQSDFFCIREIVLDWRSLMSGEAFSEKDNLDESLHYGHVGLFLNQKVEQDYFVDDLDGTSDPTDFNEDEFFDTMENESAFSDLESAIVGGSNFMAESDSVLGSDSQSLARSVRSRSHRKRQASISDVSSISEGSINKRRGPQDDNPYLNAENLARLEEDAEEEDADEFDESSDIEVESFRSAVSTSQMVDVIKTLDDDIKEAQVSVEQMLAKLSEFRVSESSQVNGDEAKRKKLKRALQLEIERTRAELLTMSATRDDLNSRLAAFSSSGKSTAKGTGRSIEMASILLKTRKKRGSAGIEESLSASRTRKTIQMSGTVETISLSFLIDPSEDPVSPLVWVRLTNSSIVFLSDTKEKKLFLSNESLAVGLNERGSDSAQHIFAGGNMEEYYSDLLSSRIPHLLPPTSFDEKLVRIAFSVVKARPGSDPQQLVRFRVALGDFQITPNPSSLRGLHGFISKLKGAPDNDPENCTTTPEPTNSGTSGSKIFFFDSLVTLTSGKILDGNSRQIALVANNMTLRISGARSDELYKDRAQVDLRCGALQLLYLGDSVNVQATELFSKRDAYHPIMRVRIRTQKAHVNDDPAWVLGKSLFLANRYPDIDPTDIVQNVHASIQVEAVNAIVSPGITAVLAALPAAWSMRKAPKQRTPKRLSAHRRIRVDFLNRKMSILVCDHLPVDQGKEENEPEKITVEFGLTSSLQIDRNMDMNLRAHFDEMSVLYSTQPVAFLKPCSAIVMVDKSEQTLTGEHRENAIMRPPDNIGWISDHNPSSLPDFPRMAKESPGTLFSLLLPRAVEIAVNPKAVAFIIQLSRELKDNVKQESVGRESVKRQSPIRHEAEAENDRKTFFRLYTERIQVAFFEKRNVVPPGSIGPQFLVGISAWTCSVEKSETGASLWMKIHEVDCVDYSLRRGLRSVGRSTLQGERGTRSSTQLPMFEANAEFSRMDEKFSSGLSVMLGSFQVLVLPSLVRSFVGFQRRLSSILGNRKKNHRSSERNFPFRIGTNVNMRLSLEVDVLEVLVPTKEVARSIRESASGELGVVSIRSGLHLESVLSADELGSVFQLAAFEIDTAREPLNEYLSRKSRENAVGNVGNVSTKFLVHEFQILRTTVKVPSSDVITFDTVGTLSRQQRVSNPFSVALHHEVAATLLETSSGAPEQSTKICISQAVEVKSEFIDILVYIARSDRGINTAIDATIRPLIEIFKDESKVSTLDDDKPSKLLPVIRLLTTSTTVASFRIEGMQVTCVPGGATRLTESPIIKFTLFRIASGCGCVGQLVPPEIRLVSNTNLDRIGTAPENEYRHLLVSVWLSCEISAYYHNRRLVEWEPFIEPWCFVARVGMDLMRVLRLPSVETDAHAIAQTDTPPSDATNSPVTTVGRLAHLGRLLTSPFGTIQNSAGVMSDSGPTLNDMDACAALLHLKVPIMLESASAPGTLEVTQFLPPSLYNGLDWIRRYGYPSQEEVASSTVDPALLCSLSDDGKLDINISGALIDTLWQYLSKIQTKERAPHLIQNHSGLTLRFQEVLDQDRTSAGERAPKVTLESGKFAPLSLRRSLSQSCDPHKAYITVELGAFDETIGRTGPFSSVPAKGSRSTVFTYRISSKIAVDTVGVFRYPLEWVSDRNTGSTMAKHGNLGYVIVRVKLEGGVKIVALESPLSLCNTSDLDLFFEMREKNGLSILWNCNLEKSNGGSTVPIPADLSVPLYTKACKLLLLAVPDNGRIDDPYTVTSDEDIMEHFKIPPQFSQSSLSRGVLSVTDMKVRLAGHTIENHSRYFTSYAVRVGGISLDQTEKMHREGKEPPIVPEQRLLLFRASTLFRNHLSLPIEIQVRAVHTPRPLSLVSQSGDAADSIHGNLDWQTLGRLDCGAFLSWSGSAPWEDLQIRFRFLEEKGGPHRLFPNWSTPSEIPPFGQNPHAKTRIRKSAKYMRSSLKGMTVLDTDSRPLLASLSLSHGTIPDKSTMYESMEFYLKNLPRSGRVVALFAPFWVVDQSGLDLQFRSGTFLAGQEQFFPDTFSEHVSDETLGLGELLDNRNLSHLPSRMSSRVHMIGDRGLSFVNVRMGRNRHGGLNDSSWSAPINLSRSRQSTKDTVVAPGRTPLDAVGSNDTGSGSFVLCSQVLDAPDQYGGSYGTKLLRLVCKYLVVNELGCDIEITSGPLNEAGSLHVKADNRARPFSFVSGRMRFRPKEYGWHWSGRFRLSLSRKDVTLRLRHGLKGHTMIVSVEFHPGETTGTSVIVFKRASHVPYKIENHSMYPIMFYQTSPFSQSSKNSSTREQQDCVILPYHSAAFAWDEPEDRWRSVGIQFADFGLLPVEMSREYLGSFDLDHLSPGSETQLREGGLVAKIIADGPTRILRISGASSLEVTGPSPRKRQPQEEFKYYPSFSAQMRLRNGVGVSIVDWSPQELLYIDLQDFLAETSIDKGKEVTNLSAGYAAVNNQLWVTPYPVAISVGSRSSRRRHRRVKALSCSWSRSLLGDHSFDGVTLLGKFEVTAEPIDVRIDGRLASLVVDMMKQTKTVLSTQTDQLNQHALSSDSGELFGGFLATDEEHPDMADELYSSLDHMATNTIAAKLRHNYRPIHRSGMLNAKISTSKPSPHFAKSKHKFYVERIRVSISSMNLSWHGFLPLASRIRPALFLEGLPVFLRPYVSSHEYGSIRHLVKGTLSHFISVRRLIDVGVGAMIRKPFFFPREIVNFVLTGLAGTLQLAERSLVAIAHANTESSWILPLTAYTAALLRGGINALQAASSIVRYGSIVPRPTGAHVRSRNPRFFAHTDGNDLLVEYVEGENAGKALLSRVRMGANLIEGYLFHVEEVFESRNVGGQQVMDNKTLILMATNERLMLLQGQLDDNFCKVTWEVTYDDIVNIECSQFGRGYNLLTLWYLREFRELEDSEDSVNRIVATSSSGLGMLYPLSMFIPRPKTRQLLDHLGMRQARFHHLLPS